MQTFNNLGRCSICGEMAELAIVCFVEICGWCHDVHI